MLRLFLLSIAILAMQGCTTFKTGGFQNPSFDANSSKQYALPSKDLPVIIQYYTNFDMDSDTDAKTRGSKAAVLESISEVINNENIKFIDDYDILPDEYIHIYVIQDLPHDPRKAYYNGFRTVSTILNIFSFMIIPAVDVDIENYVKISHMKNDTVQKSQIYTQNNRRYFSILFIPLAPFFTVENSLSESIQASLSEYFKDEV